MEKRFVYFAQFTALFILLAGSFLVLQPFLAATLLAAAGCVSTWPIYLWLLRKMKGKANVAAFTMTLSLVFVVILPLALVAYNLADNVAVFYDGLKQSIDSGPPAPPVWLKKIPLIGGFATEYWHQIVTSEQEMNAFMQRLLEPIRKILMAAGILLGEGVMEMSLAAFVSFFFYRDGTALVRFLKLAMENLVGNHAQNVLGIISNTVRGVMYGLLGTALAQGVVSTIGFTIAGVPAPLLLGVLTALFSLLPIGPPLIWAGAAIWLFSQGNVGWGIFMLLWGALLISSVDNVVKPLLISQGSNLPFLLGLFGVLGGVFAFGFVGVFIGPTLLAVGFSLMQDWATRNNAKKAALIMPVDNPSSR